MMPLQSTVPNLITPNHTSETKMNTTAFVTPKSNKSRNRFCNLMNHNSECIVEQIQENRVFLRSHNGRNFFWVNLHSDSDWEIKML
jgi:hypothetical protein